MNLPCQRVLVRRKLENFIRIKLEFLKLKTLERPVLSVVFLIPFQSIVANIKLKQQLMKVVVNLNVKDHIKYIPVELYLHDNSATILAIIIKIEIL